jgi:GT2 family glycosyltransferase
VSAAAGRVAVIVVSWNGRAHLGRCLPALAGQSYLEREILVVDNGSTDGSVAWLAEHWPAVRVIALGANAGFAAANNRGLEATDAPWIALLNNDTVPDPDWLAALVETAAADTRLGSVASRMVFLDDPSTLNSTGIAVDRAGIAWDRLGGAPVEAAARPAAVFGASAGAALYRRSALEDVAEVGRDGRATVFDERFFMYLEDVDLAWRLQLRGWRSAYAPAAGVRHHGSASAGEASPFKNRLLARNKVWTVLKCYPLPALLAYGPLILTYDLASIPYRWLLQGQTAALRGRLDAGRGLRGCLERRRRIQARRTATWADISAAMSPLASPMGVWRRYRHLAGRG